MFQNCVVANREPCGGRQPGFICFFCFRPTACGPAMSRGLVEAHGGTLELTPQEPEAGAAFVIRLPVTGLRSTTGSPPPAGACLRDRRHARPLGGPLPRPQRLSRHREAVHTRRHRGGSQGADRLSLRPRPRPRAIPHATGRREMLCATRPNHGFAAVDRRNSLEKYLQTLLK